MNTLAADLIRVGVAVTVAAMSSQTAVAQVREATPIRQSRLNSETATIKPLTLRDASRDDRWFALGARDVRWAPDGSVVYFRWNHTPRATDVPEADPWFRTDRDGRWVEQVPDEETSVIPAADVHWSRDGQYATWIHGGNVFVFDRAAGGPGRRVVSLGEPAARARVTGAGRAVDFEVDEALYRYHVGDGALEILAARVTTDSSEKTDAARWLAAQQRELFEHIRRLESERAQSAIIRRSPAEAPPQSIPVAGSATLDHLQLSPDGRYVTFRSRIRGRPRPSTEYVDFVDETGYSRVHEARPKVGEPRDVVRTGIVTYDPSVLPESVVVRWIDLPEAGTQRTVPHGPFWNLEGTRAVMQFIGEDHQDVWFAEVDMETGRTTVLTHDHDDAWIGGPPVQANYLQPALLEWLPGNQFVFASERSGWSHLYRLTSSGNIEALTEGAWEVRGATLSRDRSTWLIQAGREHPAEDHLYTLPATGGTMTRLTEDPGRHVGALSPDGARLAVTYGESTQPNDLFVRPATPAAGNRRVTVSGTDAYYEHPLVRPEIVSFTHPDGGPLWAALFTPARPHAEAPAIVHVHGGGYRQFAHRGWSVYGYALHLGFINYAVQQGYTVLDFDYRGSAGFGRAYRTDIARAMGIKDADGAAAAARYLVSEHGIDSTRIGIYGVSYGGFMTLMSQFRYPGVFAAGIARAAVTDWAHYSDRWTSRILGVPHEDPDAYRRSSPIYHAEGLQDHLLITHGLVDNNVHFQDAARLVQRLIELEKDFEVMYYPVEPHTIQSEASRYDYVKRAMGFFDRHLLRR